MTIIDMQVGDDLFKSNAQALVNASNTRGIMGAGIALQFKKRYPTMFLEYKKRCLRNELKVGKMDVHNVNGIFIINFNVTELKKDDYAYVTISKGAIELDAVMKHYNITTIAIPAIGCGIGCLVYKYVRQILINNLDKPNRIIILYPPWI